MSAIRRKCNIFTAELAGDMLFIRRSTAVTIDGERLKRRFVS
jgi:hypothetical protein